MMDRAVTDPFIEREQILLTSQNDDVARLAHYTMEATDIRFTDSLGGPPYCFRITIRDDVARAKYGANVALAAYKPWHASLHPSEFTSECIGLKETLKTRWNRKTGSKDVKATHAMLNQGSLHVPHKDHEAFIDVYTRALQAGLKMYIAEQPTPVTRMYMDLDFNQLKGLSERGIEAVSVVCTKVVARFFPGTSSRTIVAAGPHKNSSMKLPVDAANMKVPDKPEVSTIKTGVHLHWPSFLVTGPQAREIRLNVIDALIEAFGHRSTAEFRNPWTEVVDDSIYCKSSTRGGSGIRMIGSWKAKNCKDCARAVDVTCGTCRGLKHVVETDIHGAPGCPYMMLCVLGPVAPDGTVIRDLEAEAAYLSDMKSLMLDASIRTSLDTESVDMYARPPGSASLDADPGGPKKAKKPPAARNERSVDASDPVYRELQTLIREAFGSLYASVIVRSVTKSSQQYTVTVGGLNCRYCQNIGQEHRSNNIYFVVRQDGIVQRCYDGGPMDSRMLHGPCSAYQSSVMPLSVKSLAVLWQSAKETMSAFTGGLTGGLSGRADPDSELLYENPTMKALLKLGDYLAESLFGTLWTPNLGLSKGQAGHLVPQDDRDLGTRGVEAYRDLGLPWAAALLERKLDRVAEPVVYDESKSLKAVAQKVVDTFDTIVWLAANQEDPSVFDGLTSIDDILKACSRGATSFHDFFRNEKDENSNGLFIFDSDE
jgi:hypothetical protein